MAAAPLVGLASLTAAQGIAGYASSRQQANSSITEGNYQAQVYGVNASLADQQAEDAVARGREASLKVRSQANQFMGTQRVAAASSGVDPTVGSPAALTAQTRAMSELDRVTIENNAAREAYGYRTEAAGYRAQGSLAMAEGRNKAAYYRSQGYSTLLGSAAQLYHLYQKNQ